MDFESRGFVYKVAKTGEEEQLFWEDQRKLGAFFVVSCSSDI